MFKGIEKTRRELVRDKYPYQLIRYDLYDFNILKYIMYRTKRGGNMKYWSKVTYNDCIIMADTETTRIPSKQVPCINAVVAWTISIRSMGFNWVTLWGNKPSEFIDCVSLILEQLQGDKTYIYFHNLSFSNASRFSK